MALSVPKTLLLGITPAKLVLLVVFLVLFMLYYNPGFLLEIGLNYIDVY